jgi:hypothetical protein
MVCGGFIAREEKFRDRCAGIVVGVVLESEGAKKK